MDWRLSLALVIAVWGTQGILLKLAARANMLSALVFIGFGSLIAFALIAALSGVEIRGEGAIPAILAGFLGVLGLALYVYTLRTAKVSIAAPLAQLNVAVTVLLGVLLLGEQLKLTQAVGVVLALIAIFLLAL